MINKIESIAIDKLVAHPDNPNRMSKANFAKLVRNIERTGRYEPLIVRPCPGVPGSFQIINGHHRWQALAQLGYETADAVVWDIDDAQTNILLATLNRLGGSDILAKKLALLKKLTHQIQAKELAKLLPQTAKQIERLTHLKLPSAPAEPKPFATPCVFFLNDEQLADIEDALFLACLAPAPVTGATSATSAAAKRATGSSSKAAKRATGLTKIARFFLASSRSTQK
jgi:ParB/RepB/Spo0J family partition protein